MDILKEMKAKEKLEYDYSLSAANIEEEKKDWDGFSALV